MTTFKAARDAESGAIARFKDAQRETLGATAIHVTRAAREGDRSKLMKILHASTNAMTENAESINGVLAVFAAGISNPRQVKAWQSKVQHGLVVRVNMGEKSGWTGEAGHATEYKGFDGSELFKYMQTQTKVDWAKRANNVLYSAIASKLDAMLSLPAGNIAHDAIDISSEVTHAYGQLSYATTWRVLGKLAFKAALFEKYATEEPVTVGLVEHVQVTTNKLTRMRDAYDYKDNQAVAIAGDHYNMVALEDIKEEERKLDSWEYAHSQWLALQPLVDEYNANQVWADEEFKMPSSVNLEEVQTKQGQDTVQRLVRYSMSREVVDFLNNIDMPKAQREAALNALMA